MSDLDTSGFVTVEAGAEPAAEPAVEPQDAVEDPTKPKDGEDAADLAERLKEEEGAAEPKDEAEQPAKKKQTAQERIDEVTRARREAEREAKYWRDVAEGRIKPAASGAEQRPEEAKAPNPDDFDLGETDPAYIKAVIAHEVKKGVDAAKQGMAQDLHVQAEERAWEARQDAARSDFADYDQVVNSTDAEGAPKWPCSMDMAAAIRTSDAGGYLAYHLASNPEEARRISALDPHSQVRELGKLEAKLEAARAPKADPEQPKPKTATSAPKPPENQARGAGGRFEVAPDTDDFAAFEAQYGSKFGTA